MGRSFQDSASRRDSQLGRRALQEPTACISLTDREGFEPSKPLPVYRFSRPAPSATRTPVQGPDDEFGSEVYIRPTRFSDPSAQRAAASCRVLSWRPSRVSRPRRSGDSVPDASSGSSPSGAGARPAASAAATSALAYEGDEPRRVGHRRDVPLLAERDPPRTTADVDGLGEFPRLQPEDLDQSRARKRQVRLGYHPASPPRRMRPPAA